MRPTCLLTLSLALAWGVAGPAQLLRYAGVRLALTATPASIPRSPTAVPIPTLAQYPPRLGASRRRLAAELKVAADSAADEAVLEELAGAQPDGDEAEDKAVMRSPKPWSPGERRSSLRRSPGTSTSRPSTATPGSVLPGFLPGPGPRADGHLAHPHAPLRDDDPGAAAAEGLPGDLVYLALIESGFSNTATSRAKAVGMWQFMKATGKCTACGWTPGWTSAGIRTGPPTPPPAISGISTGGSARCIWPPPRTTPARARCRAGSSAARRRERFHHSDATFFRLYDTKLLRRETKDYVPKLIAAALIAKQPARYGFRSRRRSRAPTIRSSCPTMTGLDVLARLADTTVAAIRELNPQYLRLATPPGRGPSCGSRPDTGRPRWRPTPSCRRGSAVTFVEHFVARGRDAERNCAPLPGEPGDARRLEPQGAEPAGSGSDSGSWCRPAVACPPPRWRDGWRSRWSPRVPAPGPFTGSGGARPSRRSPTSTA